MLTYDISQLIEINKTGLIYLDATGNKQCIDFYECRSNWVKHVNESKMYFTWSGEPISNIKENDTNCVGRRDWFAEKPYFEFFSHSIVRFEIKPKRRAWEVFNKRWKQRYYPEFYSIQKKINDSGWCTFDMG